VAKAKDDVVKKTLKTLVTQNEQILIKLAAGLKGKTIGSYMRELALAHAEKDLKAAGVDVDKVKLPS